jgi:hypothetical protein
VTLRSLAPPTWCSAYDGNVVLRVERYPEAAWRRISIGAAEDDEVRAVTGGQVEWAFAIPWVFRALASPATGERILAAPKPGDDYSAATGYWSALLNLLIYSFGWVRPDLGLRWWYEAGKPTDDLRLRLIANTWDSDGQLDWFAAWLWSNSLAAPIAALRTDASATGRLPVAIDSDWLAAQQRSAQAAAIPTPIVGGWDPLHLSVHCSGPLEDARSEVLLLQSSRDRARAVLVLDSLIGWYRALASYGAALPHIGERSWRVDVMVKPVGWLGTYRQSRETGLWFSGPHHLHMEGN